MFLKRLLSTAALLALAAAAFGGSGALSKCVFLLLGAFLLLSGLRELAALVRKAGLGWPSPDIELCALALLAAAPWAASGADGWAGRTAGLAPVLVACAFGGVCWARLLFSSDRMASLRASAAGAAALALYLLPLWTLAALYFAGRSASGLPLDGPALALFLVLVTKCADIGAYCVGTFASRILPSGTHKVAPRTSPGKSWEGMAGGAAAAAAAACALQNAGAVHFSLAAAAAWGVVLFILGAVGDMGESALKRLAGVKDSASTIPGIGGTLDLMDSLLLGAPLFFAAAVLQ